MSDTEGSFMGTDSEGLQGGAIMMNRSDFTQGMDHLEAESKGAYVNNFPEGYDVRNRIDAHFNTLSSRPDYDGIVTDVEARAWWKNGQGAPLYINRATMNLSPVNTTDFNGQGSVITHNFFFDIGSDTDIGRVYGTLTLRLVNSYTGEVRVGSKNGARLDTYDFNGDGRLFRDAATWAARRVVGEGTGFDLLGYGSNPFVPVKLPRF